LHPRNFQGRVINEITNSRLSLSGSGFRCVPGSERCTFLDVRRPDLQSRRRWRRIYRIGI